MSEPTDLEVVRAMVRLGGTFVQALGHAFQVADTKNFATLKNAFPVYWRNYTDHARRDLAAARARGPVD